VLAALLLACSVAGVTAQDLTEPPESPPLTTAEFDYVAELGPLILLLTVSLERTRQASAALDELADFSPDQRLENAARARAEYGVWRSISARSAALDPPPEFAAFHSVYREALAELDAAAVDYLAALDAWDVSLLDEGNVHLTRFNSLKQTAEALLRERL
jgi:hypothetical protein